MSCGSHHYGGIDQKKIDVVIAQMKAHGLDVTGSNPWDVDTHKFGVKLRGSWDKATSTLTIKVTGKDFFVPCSKIWDNIDPLIHQVQKTSDAELEEAAKKLS